MTIVKGRQGTQEKDAGGDSIVEAERSGAQNEVKVELTVSKTDWKSGVQNIFWN